MIIYKVHTDKDIWKIFFNYTISLNNPFIHFNEPGGGYWFLKDSSPFYCKNGIVRRDSFSNCILPISCVSSIYIDDVYYEQFIQSMFYTSQPNYDIEEKQKLKQYIENLSTYLYSINL